MVDIHKVKAGISDYIDKEVAPKSRGLQQFIVYMAVPAINKNAEHLMEKYAENPLFCNLFEGNQIDIDELYNMAKMAIEKTGRVEAYGMLFDKSDIDKMYGYITNAR